MRYSQRNFVVGIRMNKITRIVLSVILFSTVFGIWLLGSVILIKIDSQQLLIYKNMEQKNKYIRENIDSYCRKLEKQRLIENSQQNTRNLVSFGNKNKQLQIEASQILENAQKEKIIRDNLIYFPELEQMWCLVPKGGSTSWSKAIMDRLNSDHLTTLGDLRQTNNSSFQVLLRQTYGNINKSLFVEAVTAENVKKVLLVRHPFSRIVSAYQDKLLNRKLKPDGMHFYQNYGVGINRKFRKNRKLNKTKEPTFSEFVDYLINTKPIDYDDHWKPISLLCGLCHIRYDYIIYVEDLETAANFYLESLGFPQGYSLSKENTFSNRSQEQNTFGRDLFKNISNAQKMKLLKIFQDDFRLFQYSFLKHYL